MDAACLVAQRLDAALIVVVAAESGRTALALSNRRPRRPDPGAGADRTGGAASQSLLGRGGVAPAGRASVEQELSFGMSWAKSHGLVRPGQQVVLLRGQTAGQANTVAILAREVP